MLKTRLRILMRNVKQSYFKSQRRRKIDGVVLLQELAALSCKQKSYKIGTWQQSQSDKISPTRLPY